MHVRNLYIFRDDEAVIVHLRLNIDLSFNTLQATPCL